MSDDDHGFVTMEPDVPQEAPYVYAAQLQKAREFLKSKGIHDPKPVLPMRKRRRKKADV